MCVCVYVCVYVCVCVCVCVVCVNALKWYYIPTFLIAIETAQQKFSGAKAISSDQFFGRDKEDPFVSMKELIPVLYHILQTHNANMAKFEGSSSISSDDYFGRNTTKGLYK